MVKLVYAVALGLVGAAVAHLVVLLLVPIYSQRDAWSRLAERAPIYTVVPVAGRSTGLLSKGQDPLFQSSACRFALNNSIARFAALGDVPYWSVSIYNRLGQSIYNLNDRTATDRKLDIVVTSPIQMVELRKDLPAEYENSVFVETDESEGMIVVRLFVPDQSWHGIADDFFSSAVCRQE